MSDTLHVGDLPLAEPIQVHDLAARAAALRATIGAEGHAAATLLKLPNLRVVLLALRAGALIHEHRTVGRITIQALSGRLRLRVAGHDIALAAGQLLVLDRDVAHDVAAVDDSAALLTIAWPAEVAQR